jgi:hypothetical protein
VTTQTLRGISLQNSSMMSGRKIGSPPNKGGDKYVLLNEGGLNYPAPIFCFQVLFFLAVKPAITMRTVKIADIINVDGAVNRLFYFEEFVSCYFLEDANVKWHFTDKVSYASTINHVYHLW